VGVPGPKEVLAQRVLHVATALIHQRGQQKISTVLDPRHGNENDPGHQSGFASQSFPFDTTPLAVAPLDELSGRSVAESSSHAQASKRRAMEFRVTYLKKLEQEVLEWPHISVHPHRFGGLEFQFGDAEVGHVHTNGIVDIPFTRPIHDLLLAEGLAEQHRWVPNSGWITFRIRSEQDITHALWLMRLSYLRYAPKEATDPRRLFEKESEGLRLNPRFKSLLEPFVSKNTRAVSTEPLPA
jgi:hypothetical protein